MPETYVRIAWPDGQEDTVYSPSSSIAAYFEAGTALPLAEFEARVGRALDHASQRVAAIYGFACTAALAEKGRLAAAASRYAGAEGSVHILHVTTPAYGNPR